MRRAEKKKFRGRTFGVNFGAEVLVDRPCQPLDPPTCEAPDLPWKQLEKRKKKRADIQMIRKVT